MQRFQCGTGYGDTAQRKIHNIVFKNVLGNMCPDKFDLDKFCVRLDAKLQLICGATLFYEMQWCQCGTAYGDTTQWEIHNIVFKMHLKMVCF